MPRVAEVFGERLDSAYLYGSVPRGTARVGRSDLDLLLVLCTPLLGEDLAEFLPRYRPDGLLARGTNGDLALFLPRWRASAAAAAGADALRGGVEEYTDGIGPWLAEEYARVHGVKGPRP
ncbi:hypothetical protein GPA10_18035 [Streptomyces sp. p1417]|uniref:Nucleotidyltransferase domain-containing protein n=1 Tax=Streptomyces typhae TaxID=2681492 RepID=A0A6L6WYM3_9ACTN|nr:hypothetical protein [Streptomyces typhae]